MDAGATQVGIFSKQVWVLSGERYQPTMPRRPAGVFKDKEMGS